MQGSIVPYRTVEEYCSQINEFAASTEFGLIFADDGLLLFKRWASDTVTFEPMPPCL